MNNKWLCECGHENSYISDTCPHCQKKIPKTVLDEIFASEFNNADAIIRERRLEKYLIIVKIKNIITKVLKLSSILLSLLIIVLIALLIWSTKNSDFYELYESLQKLLRLIFTIFVHIKEAINKISLVSISDKLSYVFKTIENIVIQNIINGIENFIYNTANLIENIKKIYMEVRYGIHF